MFSKRNIRDHHLNSGNKFRYFSDTFNGRDMVGNFENARFTSRSNQNILNKILFTTLITSVYFIELKHSKYVFANKT